jgi:hypothetical protein
MAALKLRDFHQRQPCAAFARENMGEDVGCDRQAGLRGNLIFGKQRAQIPQPRQRSYAGIWVMA